MAKKKKFYRTDRIDKTEAQYRVLIGQRSNGKSYAVKEKCLMKAYRHEGKFIYMRRFQFDVKQNDVNSYFGDMPIKSITQGTYEGVTCYRGDIFFCNYDEDGKEIKGDQIGKAVYLSGLHHFKSQTFPGYTDIIYEEFVVDHGYQYLDDEPSMLQQFVSTIARDNDVHVWLIGNTINRVCPYFRDWALDKVPRQEPGTIDVYTYHRKDEEGNDIETKVAVEYCESNGSGSSMFFGKVAENITDGAWDVKEMPKLPRAKDEYSILYELVLDDCGFAFVLQLLVNKDGGQIVYVYPFTGKRYIPRKITNEFSDNPLTTTCINDKIRAELKIRDLIQSNKVCYSDNLTGSDFEQVLLNRKGGL